MRGRLETMLVIRAGILVAAVVGLAACGGGEEPEGGAGEDTTASAAAETEAAEAGRTVAAGGAVAASYHAVDFAFHGPAELPAGAATLTMENGGGVLHHLQLVRLEDGHSASDLQAALTGKGALPHLPDWAVPVGGVNAVRPGATARATSVLTPGRYAALCLIPIPDGVPHVAKGMIAEIEVAGDEATAASLPPGDATVQLRDFAFQLSGTVAPGTRTVRVKNAGPAEHEVQLFRMHDGKRLSDLLEWANGFQGPPPATPLGGVPGIAPGGEAAFTADFEPGVYAFLCFIPKPEGAPGPAEAMHLHLGMASEFEVSGA